MADCDAILLSRTRATRNPDMHPASKFRNDAIGFVWVLLCMKTIPYPLNRLKKKATASYVKFAADGQGLQNDVAGTVHKQFILDTV